MFSIAILAISLTFMSNVFLQGNAANTTTAPADPCYMGCFYDKSYRDLPIAAKINLPPFQGPTLEQCLSYCACNGYSYAAMQNGAQCFCGNSYGSYGAYPSGCTFKCSNTTKLCGGGWANSVYSTKCFRATKTCPPTTTTSTTTTTTTATTSNQNVWWDISSDGYYAASLNWANTKFIGTYFFYYPPTCQRSMYMKPIFESLAKQYTNVRFAEINNQKYFPKWYRMTPSFPIAMFFGRNGTNEGPYSAFDAWEEMVKANGGEIMLCEKSNPPQIKSTKVTNTL